MSTPSFPVLVTDPLHGAGIEKLRSQPSIVVREQVRPTEEDLLALLPEMDAWIVRSGTRVKAHHLAAATRLKVVARAGVGVDNVAVEAATRCGVLVMNAPDANAITTAELAVAHMLSLSRHLVQGDRMVRSGDWNRKALVGSEVSGKTLGVLGLGRIGRHVARRGLGLEMRVLGYDPFVTADALGGLDIELADLSEVLELSDYLTLHVPLNERTRGMLDAEAFGRMRRGIRLINCARGPLIDEAALLAALEDGTVAAAALDVFQEEPPPTDHPLLRLPQVVCTPHLGASTEEASRKVALAVAQQVTAFLLRGEVANAVNLPALGADASAEVAPYLTLCRRAGSFLSQIVDWPLKAVRAEYRGEVAELPLAPMTLSFLQGLLQPVLDRPVNMINARVLAADRGCEVEERRSSGPRDFQSLVRFEAQTATGVRSVGVTLFGHRMPRIVLLDDARMEIIPEGDLVVLRNQDRPGVIGRLGTLLGEKKINIGNMNVSPPAADGLCHAVLGVSAPLPEALVAELARLEEIRDVRVVSLA